MDKSHIQDIEIKAAVITVSTTRTKDEDKSGKKILSLFAEQNIEVNFYEVVPDSEEKIQNACKEAMKTSNCIVFDGGTGITHDDCTIEAITPLLGKKIDGFGEYFRMKSYEDIGGAALLSRAIAGVTDKKVIFCIPGSTGAVTLAMTQIILPNIKHILTHASK